jgi:uncharacterized protein YbaP (TraB family)
MSLPRFLARLFAGLTLSLALAATVQAQPPVWKLSDEDSEIYLFGTVHLLPPDVDWRSEDMQAAFDAATTVYFEAPVQDPDAQAGMVRVIQQTGLNPPGVTLSSLLSEDGNARLAELGPRLGFAPVALEPLRPWLAGIQIGVAQIVADGYDPSSGVETTLWPEAVDAGKELAFFETLEQQIGFFADMPIETQIGFLEGALEQIDEAPDMLDELVEHWLAGDMDAFEALVNEGMRETPGVYQAILVDRNIAWVDEIENMLDGSGVVFIAVGAAHLPGEQGVVTLLRERGYAVDGP